MDKEGYPAMDPISLTNSLWDTLLSKFRNNLYYSLYDNLRGDLWDTLGNYLWDSLKGSLYNNICEELFEDLNGGTHLEDKER